MHHPTRNLEQSLLLVAFLALVGLLLGLALGLGVAKVAGAWPWPWWQWVQAAGMAWLNPSRVWPAEIEALRGAYYLFWYPLPILGALLGAWAGWAATSPVPAEIHEAGRELLQGREALRVAEEEAEEEAERSGPGLPIHPQVNLSLDRETRHLMVLGSTGGGKTVILSPLIAAAQARGDKCLIYDNKGDFTSSLPGIILAPWDKRCEAWDVAADVLNRADARRLAEQLIADTQEPIWADGARAILVALVIMLQETRPGAWDFKDLMQASTVPFEELQKIVFNFYPEGMRAVEEPGKTVQSFLINIATALSHICDLADAWAGRPRWSFRRWILDPQSHEAQHPEQTIILQGSERYRPLRRAYVQAIISTIGAILCSPDCPNSRERRVWLFLDEFKQLGKLQDFGGFLEVGRSKGLRVVMGFQDVAQIREVYSRDVADAWSSMVGSFVVCRTQGVETPSWLSRLIGQRRVLRYCITQAEGGGRTAGYQPEERPVVRADEISTILGPAKEGIQAIWFPGGEYAYLLTWPYPPKSAALRPPLVPNPALGGRASRAVLQAAYEAAATAETVTATLAPAEAQEEAEPAPQTAPLPEPDLAPLDLAPSLTDEQCEPEEEAGAGPEELNEEPKDGHLLPEEVEEEIAQEMVQDLAEAALQQVAPALVPGIEALAVVAQLADVIQDVTPAVSSTGPAPAPIPHTNTAVEAEEEEQENG